MPSMAKALGVDIGGTKIAVAAVDDRGKIHAREAITTEAEQGFPRAISRIAVAADRVLASAGWSRDELMGVGVGCTGPVSAERGIVNNPYTLPTWVDCPLVERLRAAFERPAYLENDADAAALGEWFAGAARGAHLACMLTLGTGVGGGLVVGGRVFRGVQGEHPELGHIPIDPAGPACYCGSTGCLESIASGTAIGRAAELSGLTDSRDVFEKASLGHAGARQIVERVQAALATAAWTIVHTYMPELIVLGGGIIDEHYELFAPQMQQCIDRATMVPRGGVRVVRAVLGNDAGLVGAASLAFSNARA